MDDLQASLAKSSLASSPHSNHTGIVAALTCFYQLFADLRIFPASNILIPPTGGWPQHRLSKDEAHTFGFQEDTINVAAKLLYLDNVEYYIAQETRLNSYVDQLGGGAWELSRNPGTEPDHEPDVNPIPANLLLLTQPSYYVYTALVYDCRNGN